MGDLVRLKLSENRDAAQTERAKRGTVVISRVTAIIGLVAGILGAVNYLLPSLLKSPAPGSHSAKPDAPPPLPPR